MQNTPHPQPNGLPFSKALIPLLLLTGMFFMNFFSRVLLSPLMPRIEQDLRISHAQAGGLFLFLSTGYCISVFGSGFVSARLDHARTILLSALLVTGCLAWVSRCESLGQMCVALFALGVAAGWYIPSSIATITALVQPPHWGRAIAVHELAPNAGFVLAPLVASVVLQVMTWRTAIFLTAVATIAVAFAFATLGKGGRFRGRSPNVRALSALFVQKRFWSVAALFALGVSGTLGVFNMLPLYLVSHHGEALTTANTLIGLSRALSIAAALAAGWITDRLGPSRTIIWVFAFSGLCTVALGLSSGIALWAALFVQPLFAVCFFPAGFVAISRIGDAEDRNLAVSVVVPFGFLVGGGIVPAGIGFLGERGAFDMGIALAGALICAGALIAARLRI